MTAEKLEELLDSLPDAIMLDGYDDCIVGIAERFGMPTVLAYDKEKMLARLTESDGMNGEEAEEFFYYNIIGGWVGEATPMFVTLEA